MESIRALSLELISQTAHVANALDAARDAEPVLLDSEIRKKRDNLCSRLLASLPSKKEFLHSGEIEDLLLDSILEDPDDLPGYFLGRLLTPTREYRFSLQLPTRGPAGYDLDSRSFALSSHLSAPLFSHRLSGAVQAATFAAAARKTEEFLAQVIGACIALRIVGIYFSTAWAPNKALNVELSLTSGTSRTLPLTAHGSSIASRVVFVPPQSVTDLDVDSLEGGRGERIASRVCRTLGVLMDPFSKEKSQDLRAACALLLRAVADPEPGMAFVFAFMSLEGALLERRAKDNVLACLVEAIGYRVGCSRGERELIREEVKRFYDLRSQFVHTGQVSGAWEERERCVELAARVLERELWDLASGG